jgi:hypothetical protein
LPQKLEKLYPEIDSAIKVPSTPVVVELSGISRDRLLNKRGICDPAFVDSELQNYEDSKNSIGSSFPLAFVIRNVRPEDVVAVHDLDNWTVEEARAGSQLDQSKVAGSRQPVRDWLARLA